MSVHRRAFLAGLGGIAVALPHLEFFMPRIARAAPNGPKRFITFFHHQGTVLRSWLPQGSESSFTLPTILSPLDPYKQRLLVLAGVDNKVAPLNARSNGHNSSARTVLTCQPFAGSVDASGRLKPADQQPSDDHAGGPSIDQVIAQRIRGNSRYTSIDLAIGCGDAPVRSPVSRVFYAGKNDPITSTGHPQDAFDRLFAGSQQSAQELARLRARRQSVLDAVQDGFGGLRSRVGREDKERLDAHAQKIRDLEQRLLAPTATCAPPVLGLRRPDWRATGNYNFITDDDITAPAQIEILVMALSCGLTNVGSLWFGTGDGPSFPWIQPGVVPPARYDRWHTMVHDGRNRADLGGADEPGLINGFRWYTQQFAYLLRALTNARDAAGPLIDSTCVLWTSEFGNGYGHNTEKLPIILAGNFGGASGRFLSHMRPDWSASNYSTNQVFTSLLQAFGGSDTEFGWRGVGSGPMPGVLS